MARKMRLNTFLKSNIIRAHLKLLYNDRKSQELLIRAQVQILVYLQKLRSNNDIINSN
jgi:hypothetical protein